MWWRIQPPGLDQLNHGSTTGARGQLNRVRRLEYATGGGGHGARVSGTRRIDGTGAQHARTSMWDAGKWWRNVDEAIVCCSSLPRRAREISAETDRSDASIMRARERLETNETVKGR